MKYVRKLCSGNARLRYLVDRDYQEEFYVRSLDWKFIQKVHSESDKLFFTERVNKFFKNLVSLLLSM